MISVIHFSSLIVYSDGKVEQIPPGIFMSTCKVFNLYILYFIFQSTCKVDILVFNLSCKIIQVDMTWFPFDEQICDLKFGTWTNHESLVKTFDCIFFSSNSFFRSSSTKELDLKN